MRKYYLSKSPLYSLVMTYLLTPGVGLEKHLKPNSVHTRIAFICFFILIKLVKIFRKLFLNSLCRHVMDNYFSYKIYINQVFCLIALVVAIK